MCPPKISEDKVIHMKNEILNEAVERQRAAEAVYQAVREWQTKSETTHPGGFQRRRASDCEHFPPDRAAWLRARAAEILEAEK